MKIKCLEPFKNKLGIAEKTLTILVLFSFAYFAGCLLLFVPAFQSIIIMFGEFLVRRPLNRPVWHDRFMVWPFQLAVLYVLFLIVFFSENMFIGDFLRKNKKRIHFFVILFLLLGIFAIMFQANWTFGDDHQFIRTTAVNKYVPFYPYISGGRFVPLGLIHYNIPLFVFRLLGINSGLPVEAHFVLVALFFSVTVVCLFLLFTRIEPVKERIHPVFTLFFSCTFFLLGESFYRIFMRLIYPETPVIMLFSVFILMYFRALETDKKRYYTAALLAAVYSSYCKEPGFGAFLVVAASNHLFRYKNQSTRERLFHTALIANGILFITLYYFFSFRNTTEFYNEGRVAISVARFIISILSNNPVLILMLIFALLRLGAVVIKKDKAHLYYDSLLFAGTAYSFAYVLLHLNNGYYFLPSIILFLPSLVYWVKYWYQTNKNYALPVFGCIMLLWFYNIGGIAPGIPNTWKDRNEFIPYIATLHLEYEEGKNFIWYESDNTVNDNTSYKVVRGWKKHIENAFLNYMNKSEGEEFFAVMKNMDEIDLNENVLFFYPTDNDQGQPMPSRLAEKLSESNFELFLDSSYGILIYRQR
jgi:hypothetical protein